MANTRSGSGTERLRELHHAATDLMSASDEEAVYRTTVETAQRVLGFDFCTVFVRLDDEFEIVASSHREPGVTVPVRGGVLEQTSQNDEAYLVRDVDQHPVAKPRKQDFNSAVSVPMGKFAVLQTVSQTRNYYGETDLELAELLALHAEAALKQVRSEDLIREQKRKIEQLHAVSTEIESCQTREDLYELMREASQEILGLDWCTFYVMEDGEFVTAMASEMSPVTVGEHPFPEGQSKAREVLETGESHFVDDLHELDEGEPTTNRIRSALQVPVGDIGVYNAAHEQPGMFDQDDLELAELLATSVAEAYERIETQEQLRAQTRKLQQKNEHLDQFVSLISHDLRNPLNVAKLRTELVLQDRQDENIEAINDALARMEEMIDELMTLARAGQEIESTRECSLQQLINRAWSNVQTPEATLEASVEDASIEADSNRLLHVFENLFRNSVEHGFPDGLEQSDGTTQPESPPVVRVGTLDTESGFYVEDNGKGIPADKREGIFDHGFTTGEDGVGLGLAIVEEIVEAHGWRIAATESDDGGARFEVRTDPQ